MLIDKNYNVLKSGIQQTSKTLQWMWIYKSARYIHTANRNVDWIWCQIRVYGVILRNACHALLQCDSMSYLFYAGSQNFQTLFLGYYLWKINEKVNFPKLCPSAPFPIILHIAILN